MEALYNIYISEELIVINGSKKEKNKLNKKEKLKNGDQNLIKKGNKIKINTINILKWRFIKKQFNQKYNGD